MTTRTRNAVTWIQTYSGRRFAPLQPRAEDLDLVDIAHALSLLCRFNGHCRTFYSVAEHCVRVSRALPDELALWGLLHDSAEAYLSDLPRPVKLEIPYFVEIEERLLRLVARRFELVWPMPPSVAEADTRLLATEARDLMAPPPHPWDLGVEPLDGTIEPLSAPEAEDAFLRRYDELRSR